MSGRVKQLAEREAMLQQRCAAQRASIAHEVANIGTAPVTPSVYFQIVRDGNKPEGESSLYYTYTGPVVFTGQEKFRKVEFSAIEKNKAELP